MKVALVHYRGGLMDGVSLEMDKWKEALQQLGYSVDIVAGNESSGVDVTIPQIGFEDVDYRIIGKNAFEKLEDFTADGLIGKIQEKSQEIEKLLDAKLSDYDVIIPNNIWSLGASLPVAIALYNFAQKHPDKLFIAHHHDFWWERTYFLNPTVPKIGEMLAEYCPPVLENLKHVVINSFARGELKRRKGVDSTIVPNVLDFSAAAWVSEKCNQEIRKRYGIKPGDIVVLQATRIAPRKAIEVAVDVVSDMNRLKGRYVGKKLYNGQEFTGRIVLAFSGMTEANTIDYRDRLLALAKEKGVEIIDIYSSIEAGIWSFWDAYSVADVITYPSILEGWGNQLLEAVFAKKVIVLFEYDIFRSDIKPVNLDYISLGDAYGTIDGLVYVSSKIVNEAACEVLNILFDSDRYKEAVEHNFEVCRENFGFGKLKELVSGLIDSLGG